MLASLGNTETKAISIHSSFQALDMM
uniref:Uncharacterized protein n=1 Tax=Rhizophora mucronata TaxID=61149 RepID=A0A2P2NWZ6_RHIMU